MTFGTKAFSAQDALVDALKSEPSLAAWQIDFGIPSRREELHIWIDEEVADWTQELASTGLQSRNETFNLAIYVYDRKTDATAKEIRDEIKAAADTITDILGGGSFLGGIVLIAEVVGGAYEGAFADPDGLRREGVLKLTIGCQAFLA